MLPTLTSSPLSSALVYSDSVLAWKALVCTLPALPLIRATLEQLSLFSHILFPRIRPLWGPVPVCLLFITDCNHPAPNNHCIRERKTYFKSWENCSIRTICVCLRTSLYSLYKHANLPKTSKRQVLAMVWTGRSGSQPLFSLTPHFQSSCWTLTPGMFGVSLLLGHFSPKDRACFSVKGFDLTSVCHQRAAESTTL